MSNRTSTPALRILLCLIGWHKWSYANRRSGPRFCEYCDVQQNLTDRGWRA